ALAELFLDSAFSVEKGVVEPEIQRWRTGAQRDFVPVPLEVVAVEAKAIQQVEILGGRDVHPADDIGKLLLDARAVGEGVVVGEGVALAEKQAGEAAIIAIQAPAPAVIDTLAAIDPIDA